MAISSSSYDRFQPPGPEDIGDTLAQMHEDMRRIVALAEAGCSAEGFGGFGYLSEIGDIASRWIEDTPAGDGEIPF